MTNKYNVQLITDVNGKPMPQYYDETEGVMKPITRDNGEITGDVNANVSFPETQNVNGTVSVDNFPKTQQVEVTNQKEVQDVNVTNQATSVDVNNFPELQDVSIQGREAEFETIMNNEVIEAGESSGRIDINTKGCKRIIIALNADVRWSLATNSFWTNVINYNHLFPRRFDDQEPAPNTNYPQESVIGLNLNDATSFYDAIRNGFLPANIKINVYNRDATDGLFTIKLMRLWEV